MDSAKCDIDSKCCHPPRRDSSVMVGLKNARVWSHEGVTGLMVGKVMVFLQRSMFEFPTDPLAEGAVVCDGDVLNETLPSLCEEFIQRAFRRL